MNIILYLLQIIQYQYKIIGQLFNFICRYIPLKQWTFDDSHSPKHQNLRLMNSLESYPTNRTGSGMILFLTTKNAMVKPLNLYFVELNVTSLRSAHALSVMHHSLISHGMMVRKNHRFVALIVPISLSL